MCYDPSRIVSRFIDKYGIYGEWTLDAFNEADPNQCFYGEDVNPDEYVSLASRYLDMQNAEHNVVKNVDKLLARYYRVSDSARQELISLLVEIEEWDPIAADRCDD